MASQRVTGLVALAAGLLLVGCGTSATTAPTTSPTGVPLATSTPVPTLAGTTTFAVALPGPNAISNVSILGAMDALRAQGYTINTTNVADPNLIAQGMTQGTFQFTTGDTGVALRAIQAGAKMKIFGESVGDNWQIVALSTIKECKDLKGRSVGVFAVGTFNDVSVRQYISANCPGTNINMLSLGNSVARAAAMLAGQLDASPLFLNDAITLLKAGGDRFHVLTSFTETLPDLRPSTMLVNTDFMTQNPGTVRAFLTAEVKEHRKLQSDAAYFKAQATKYVENVDQTTLDQVIKEWQRLRLFDPNGGLTADNMNYTLQFFVGAGNILPGLKVEDVADLSVLNSVLDELGRQ